MQGDPLRSAGFAHPYAIVIERLLIWNTRMDVRLMRAACIFMTVILLLSGDAKPRSVFMLRSFLPELRLGTNQKSLVRSVQSELRRRR